MANAGITWNPLDRIGLIASGIGSGNLGQISQGVIGGDITPGGNITKHGYVADAAPKAPIRTAPALHLEDTFNPAGGGSGQYAGSGGSTSAAPAHTAADEAAYYDDQINALNQLLGLTNTQMTNGVNRLNSSFGSQTQQLNDQKTKAMNGYDQQNLTNAQDKQHGVESVDNFANNSFNSLQRLLGGAHAGNSSVARELVPYLISKGAGTRRQGVFDQAGKNDQAIASARGDATDQFNFNAQDLANQRKSQEENFREGILNKQNDLFSQKRALEIQKAQASGQGYEAARAAGEASQNSINSRMAQLNSLFGQFNPTFTAKTLNLKTPDLGQFTVDPAQISADQGLPAESRYYLPQLKKKLDGSLG